MDFDENNSSNMLDDETANFGVVPKFKVDESGRRIQLDRERLILFSNYKFSLAIWESLHSQSLST